MNNRSSGPASGPVPIADGPTISAATIGALVGQADALHDAGHLAEAEAVYRRAATLAPRVPEIQFGRATVLSDLGRFKEAAHVYRRILAVSPDFAEARVNLGMALRELGRLNEAASEFETALRLKPEIPFALVELVSALSALRRSHEAVDWATGAMRRSPRSSDACRAFATALAHSAPLDHSPEIATFLEHCLRSEVVEHQGLETACAWQLGQKYGIDPSPTDAARAAVDDAIAKGAAGCFADPLLLQLLVAVVNTDPELELFLTEARRRLVGAHGLPPSLDPFLAALALQCFSNGYVYAVSAEEEAHIGALRTELEGELSRGSPPHPSFESRLLRFALYEPLTALGGAARLLETAIPVGSPLSTVIARCLAEPLEEVALAREIPGLGTIENAVSQAVRGQYEAHPYPRWLSLPRVEPVPFAVISRRKFPRLSLPTFLEGPIEVLVVGCGTGRQPITTALSVAQARVLAVDLSRASLGYARRMARHLGATNVGFLHADLLNLGELARDFPVVEAVGVLHHMEDPMAGWRALCGLLRAGGLMLVGLYSALARAEVAAARERIAQLGIAPTPNHIRAFRHSLLFGDERGQFPELARSKDIHDLNGCRDLLFHEKEHRFTLPQIGGMLQSLGLEFLGFDLLDERTLRAYRAAYPDGAAASDLACWARFEEAHREAFSGMYIFWCRKPPAR